MKYFILALTILGTPLFARAELNLTPAEKFADGEVVKILIVPGHDDESPGAVFRGFREADMSLALAEKIRIALVADPNIEVTVSRDEMGYISEVKKYFEDHRKDIQNFIDSHKEETERDLKKDKIIISDQVVHNNARPEVAFRLYGVNKWADESDFDFIINIHFNDDTSHWGNNVGKYGGYTIYAPDPNLPNSLASAPLAEALGRAMKKSFSRTNLPLEAEKADDLGVVPDFKLIAVGSNGSLFTPTALVEYSYIYEPHVSKELFEVSADAMAGATKNAIYDFLGSPKDAPNLSYDFTNTLGPSTKKNLDNLALQLMLKERGFYPPKNFDEVDCPLTGIFGPCTQKALKAFQAANNLTADGLAGKKTFEILR